jgi:hypothetical protein
MKEVPLRRRFGPAQEADAGPAGGDGTSQPAMPLPSAGVD